MPSPTRRSSSWISWAERKSSRRSSSAETAARCRVARTARAVVTTGLLRVRDGVDHDVRQVVVDQRVHDLPAAALAAHDPRRLEHPQVLADQGLGTAERVDEIVHAARLPRSSSSTIAIRTGAARARSRSPAAAKSRVLRAGATVGQICPECAQLGSASTAVDCLLGRCVTAPIVDSRRAPPGVDTDNRVRLAVARAARLPLRRAHGCGRLHRAGAARTRAAHRGPRVPGRCGRAGGRRPGAVGPDRALRLRRRLPPRL